MTDERMVLAGDFPTATQEEWDTEVLKALNRKRPPGSQLTIEQAIKRLTTVMVDGVEIDPLYLKPDDQRIGYPAQTPFTRGAALADPAAPWVVAQLMEDPDVARAAEAILADLNAGATGVWARVDADAVKPSDLGTVLAGVEPEAASIAVSSVSRQAEAADALLDFWAATGKTDVSGNLGIDPMAAAAVTGDGADLSQLASWVGKAKAYSRVRALTVDVTPYDNAGAGDIDQLAFAIATGIEYARALDDQGLSALDAFDQIAFRVSATADEFLTIARLRALRRVWARVGEVLDVPESHRGAIQHAVTSWRIVSKDDPWVNLLRHTIATFSAAVGGAEIVTVLPHDTAYGLPTPFSRRVARNIQLVAAEESHLGASKDPAGGAWVFESLTEQLAQKAWARVQQIESLGGMSQALAGGQVAAWIDATATERAARLATRKLPLTGVSMFPKQDEEPLAQFVPRPARPAYAGLVPHRDSEVFEDLRDRSRAHEAFTGRKPRVVLACLGERRDFGAREQFTTNLLLVGGLEFIEVEGPTPDEIVATAREVETPLVILASSGKVYAEQAIAAAEAARTAGLEVWLAGRITEIDDDRAQGLIAGEIFDGMNVVAFLTDTLDNLGVAE
ncbi:MAG: methylmalonyl-CoA mutase family protein [Propionibacteriaceae bacterium]|nr:methylmalonyl-CoA mutase family protein [Propionibacteriaceae bacterium]